MVNNTEAADQRASPLMPWRRLIHIEPFGVRTAVATVLPLIVGQMIGRPGIGLMVGLGGLYGSLADKEGATLRTLLLTVAAVALTASIATVVGNYAVLAIAIMFAWAFGGGMLASLGILPGHIGFVSTIAFAVMLGVPGTFTTALGRLEQFSVGGLWAICLTLLLWRYEGRQTPSARPDRHRSPLAWKQYAQQVRSQWNRQSDTFQHALRLGFISALAVALYKLLHLPHGSWLTLTVLVIVKPDYSSTRQRAVERVIGTLIGAVLSLVTAALVRHVVIADIALLGLSALAYSNQRHNYGLFVVFLTPFVLMLLSIASPGTPRLTPERIGDTLLGGALALAAAYLLMPRSVGET